VIAALEAQRNELQVRSEGAHLGERRAAIGRIVMIAIFAIIATTRKGPHNTWQTVAGAMFSIYAVSVLIAVYRIKVAKPERSRCSTSWAPGCSAASTSGSPASSTWASTRSRRRS
jgi:hypothetical protein